MFLLVAENKPDQDEVVQTVLCASLSDESRVSEALDLLKSIEAWCDYGPSPARFPPCIPTGMLLRADSNDRRLRTQGFHRRQ